MKPSILLVYTVIGRMYIQIGWSLYLGMEVLKDIPERESENKTELSVVKARERGSLFEWLWVGRIIAIFGVCL